MDETENIDDEECYELSSIIEDEDTLIVLKRKYLIGIPLSEEEQQILDESWSDDKIMPESMLREDDVGYEDIKDCVEKESGLHKQEKKDQGAREPVFKSPADCKCIFSMLDAMTTRGLHSLCMTLTGGKVEFEKTKYKMRKKIKKQLRKVIANKAATSNILLEQLSQLVTDPNNFLESHLASTTSHEAYSDAANKVLDELDDLCPIALDAMHRILLGKETTPSVGRKRQRSTYLISSIRGHCKEMITELSEGGEPAEKLASVLGIASLALKHLLKREYLFECGDMDEVPDSLQKTLDIINDETLPQSKKKSVRLSPQEVKDQMLQEVECVSRLSAQLKQVLLDSLQKQEFDEDFAGAYMENYDESDSPDFSDDDDDWMIGSSSMNHYRNNDDTESIGETSPPVSSSPVSTSSVMDSSLKKKKGKMGEVQVEKENIDSLQSGFSNAYLEMQEACDATSMEAYKFVCQKLLRLLLAQRLLYL